MERLFVDDIFDSHQLVPQLARRDVCDVNIVGANHLSLRFAHTRYIRDGGSGLARRTNEEDHRTTDSTKFFG